MLTMINWLEDAEKFEIAGRGIVYSGKAPFDFDRNNQEDMNRFYKMPWVISHPDAKDKLWRVKAIESWALNKIGKNSPIGLLVEPWE